MVPTCQNWYSEHQKCQNHDDISKYTGARGGAIIPHASKKLWKSLSF